MPIRFIAALAALCASLSVFAATGTKPLQRAGEWETKIVLERDGKKLDPIVRRHCVMPSDVEKAEQGLFQPFETGCTGRHERKGKTVTWSYECTGATPMNGSGKLTVGKDEYSGTSESVADLSGGKRLKMAATKTEFSARRVGDCDTSHKSIFKDRQ